MVGFSAGGHLSYLAACRLPVSRTAVLYGGWLPSTDIPMSQPTPTLELTPGITGRILYLVGEDDTLIDAGQREQIRGGAGGRGRRARAGQLPRRRARVLLAGHAAVQPGGPGRRVGPDAGVARVLDLGCGAGIPATRKLCDRGLQVVGVDFSAVQLRRARRLVPAAALVQADMAALHFAPASLDAVVSFYALIHLPVGDQRRVFGRIRGWLRPAGLFLAIVGAQPWTGTERFFGADMFWDHPGTGSYLDWLEESGFVTLWERFIPEGDGGHSLILARVA